MSKYIEALKLFAADDDIRDWMNHPFTIGDESFATDGHFIAVVDSILSKRYTAIEHSIEKMVLNVLPKGTNIDFLIDIEDLAKSISSIPMVNKSIKEEEECEACDGEGEVEADFYYNNRYYSVDGDCPVCSGRGYVFQKSDNKQVRDTDFKIQIKECWFGVGKIEQMIKACKILEWPTLNLVHQTDSHKPSIFQISEMKVLLMPVSQFDGQDINKLIKVELLDK